MENPSTWTELEKVIYKALDDADQMRKLGFIGLSETRVIADALRRAGLVVDDERTQTRQYPEPRLQTGNEDD